MSEWIYSFLPVIRELGFLGYWLLAAVTFGESFVIAGMFVPGTIILILMGSLTSYGYYEFHWLAVFAIAGAMLGNSVSYEIGRAGRFHVERFAFVRKYLASGKAFFQKHGGKSIFLGRFVGPIRPVIPFIAGITEMPRVQFYIYNIVSAIIWCASYLFIGSVFGYAWKSALTWSSIGITVLCAIAALALFIAWKRRQKIVTDRVA